MTNFFNDLIANSAVQGVTELVLIGDIVELWLADFSGVAPPLICGLLKLADWPAEYPLTPVEVLNVQQSFGANVSSYFAQLRALAASGVRIVAMPGNHGSS